MFPRSSKPKTIHTEEELDRLSRNDIYRRKKIVLDLVTYLLTFLLTVMVGLITWSLIFNESFREKALEIILNNLVAIIISAFAILGITRTR
jgi:hypothetical protein